MFDWLKRQIDAAFGWDTSPSNPMPIPENGDFKGMPNAVIHFVEETRMGLHSQDAAMGELLYTAKVSREDFARFCAAFAEGVLHEYKQLGTAPYEIKLTDETVPTPHYNLETKTILIPRRFIAETLSYKTLSQSKTGNLSLSPFQQAVMYGVEEAAHCYEFAKQKNYYTPYLNSLKTPDGSSLYDINPIERFAKIRVQNALRDYGWDQPVLAVPEPAIAASWQARERERQDQRMVAAELAV